MSQATSSSSSLEDKINDYFLQWANQCLEIKKLDKLKAQANDLDVQIDDKSKKMRTYVDKKQTIRIIEKTMEMLDKMDTKHELIDLDYFKNLKARLNKKVDAGRDCAWDEMVNMAPAENKDEISEQLKLMKELVDGLPDPKIVSNHLKELSMELEQQQEKEKHFNNLLKETAVTERKVKNLLFSRHLLNQGHEDLSNTSSKKEIASSNSLSEVEH